MSEEEGRKVMEKAREKSENPMTFFEKFVEFQVKFYIYCMA